MHRILIAFGTVFSILVLTASQALAYDCTVANKPATAGAAYVVNFDTGQMTATKPNPGTFVYPGSPDNQLHGGFIAFQGTLPDGTAVSTSTFVHAPLNAQAPTAEPGVIPGATQQASQAGKGCDGKGLDLLEVCFGQ